MKYILIFILILNSFLTYSQQSPDIIRALDLSQVSKHQIKYFWLDINSDQSNMIPIIVAKGSSDSIVLGLTAAIHGNEVNGIAVIHKLMEEIDVNTLNGTIIAIPGLNSVSLPLHQRRFIDQTDLNRIFPGKKDGNRSQRFVWEITENILPHFDYLVDMHTASFGRENTLYIRANLSDPTIRKMAELQDADIILKSEGTPSAAISSSKSLTMRAQASVMGIPTITVEYGNPQVFQAEMINRGVSGMKNIMSWLGMVNAPLLEVTKPIICTHSYWIYLDKPGIMEVVVDLRQELKKGDLIAELRNPFGILIKSYYTPENGIVIGRSSNPINMAGGRIIHLGIISKD